MAACSKPLTSGASLVMAAVLLAACGGDGEDAPSQPAAQVEHSAPAMEAAPPAMNADPPGMDAECWPNCPGVDQ